jgi:hypothetical protein
MNIRGSRQPGNSYRVEDSRQGSATRLIAVSYDNPASADRARHALSGGRRAIAFLGAGVGAVTVATDSYAGGEQGLNLVRERRNAAADGFAAAH